jgi:AcrR family transcriptional regulator
MPISLPPARWRRHSRWRSQKLAGFPGQNAEPGLSSRVCRFLDHAGLAVPDSRPAPRKLPRQERSRALYEAILVAAEELLEKQGPGFTLADVAARAGVGSGSFYQYFPDRSALIGALIDRQIAADRAALDLLRGMHENELTDLPELLVKSVLKLYGARPKSMSGMVALLRELGRDGDVAALIEECCEAVAGWVERGQPGSDRAACLDAARGAVYALLGIVRQAACDTPERLGGDEVFRGRLVAVARAALTLR